ncbi:MAG: glutathione synthase [Myxococcales bacterium]|nr:glutathione synthase [Myxococcales bacterium]
MRILVVMDPPERVNRYSDSTLVIVEEALRRRHDVAVCTPADLWAEDGDLGAAYHHALLPLEGAPETPGLRVGKASAALIDGRFDLVLMRKDPPFDLDYFLTTHLLERLRGRVRVVNDPRGLREANEKLYALRFPSLVPPTLVARGQAALIDFMRKQGGEMIIKPLDSCGGAGVFHLHLGDRNLHAILEAATCLGRKPVMAQRYLPEARQGDKRILLLDGEILGAVLRVPREDETRGNLHVGARPEHAVLDERDHEIVRTIRPSLAADGLSLVGLDVIGGNLTEVNVTSPTGIQEINRLEGGKLEARVVDWLERQKAL